jgi:chorismate mutase
MVKTGRLSKVELDFIRQNIDKNVDEIALELNRSVHLVKKAVTKLKKKSPPKKEKTIKRRPQESQLMKLMGRHKRGDTNVATVMTPAASQLADSTRRSRLKNKKIQESIHRPLDK